MSSKRMPGEGKSGNCLRALFRLILRLESSEELAVEAVDFVPWAALACDNVGSGFDEGGWAQVEEDSGFKRVDGSDWETGLDIVKEEKKKRERRPGGMDDYLICSEKTGENLCFLRVGSWQSFRD